MAKVCMIERDKKRRRMAKKYSAKREKLRALANDKSVNPEERFQATLKLAELPRNSSKTRIHNRCAVTGRPRANFRRFNLCRVVLRELASSGELPGVKKSSW